MLHTFVENEKESRKNENKKDSIVKIEYARDKAPAGEVFFKKVLRSKKNDSRTKFVIQTLLAREKVDALVLEFFDLWLDKLGQCMTVQGQLSLSA